MDNLYAWTLALCFTNGPHSPCDESHWFWLTGTRAWETLSACDEDWHRHVSALEARPGWRGHVTVGIHMCGWGKTASMMDPLSDLRVVSGSRVIATSD